MALPRTFERFEPDFTRVVKMPAGDQTVIARRAFIPFEAKRRVGNDDAVEDFPQGHDRRDIRGDLAAQRAQDFGHQFWPWRFAA
ncbi:hypothetical protein D3C81_1952370 [compost metagenome]